MGKGNKKKKKGSDESKRMYGSVLNNLFYSSQLKVYAAVYTVGGFVT